MDAVVGVPELKFVISTKYVVVAKLLFVESSAPVSSYAVIIK
jgi:hypothetical protein